MLSKFSLLIFLILFGCMAHTIRKKPTGEHHQKQNLALYNQIKAIAQNGDWLVTRGYHVTDNLVANATGIPLSHTGIYDADSLIVIEAEEMGVHQTLLEDFIDKSHRILVMRPKWATTENHNLALDNAKKLVGKKYDFLGIIGFNFPDKYYCSELAIYMYKQWHNPQEKFPVVIKPGELYLYGKILYDSLPREEMKF